MTSEEKVYGTDFGELMASQQVDDIEIEHRGKIWKFKIKKEPTFAEHMEATSNASYYTKTGELKFNIEAYFLTMLEKMLVSAPFQIYKTTLKSLSPEIGQKLISFLPPPMTGGSEDTKNSSEESLEETS